MTNEDIVRDFFAAIYRLDFDAAVEFFTNDGSYHDMPLPTDPTVGKAGIRRKLDFMIMGGVESMDYEIRHLVSAGEVVLVERSETWNFPSGARPTLRVMCTIELVGGQIRAWREYWNHEELMSQMPKEFFDGIAAAAP